MVTNLEEQFEESEEDLSDYDEQLQISNTPKRANPFTDNAGKPKKLKSDLYKQPTTEELNQLRETETLFNSNIFRLQISELLQEVSIKPKYSALFETWFEQFKEYLIKLPENHCEIEVGVKVVKQTKFFATFLKNIAKNNELKDVKIKLLKPKLAVKFGKYQNVPNQLIKFTENLLLIMPKEIFIEKDYLNYRYFKKKHAYLVYLQQYLEKFQEIQSVLIKNYLQNDKLLYLEIIPSCDKSMVINLFVAPEEGTFKHKRFLPDKNNVKQYEFSEFTEFNVENFAAQGTFLYNSLLLFDNTLKENQEFIENTVSPLSNVQEGIKLLIVWLQQRQLNCTFHDFTSDILVYLITYLVSKKKLNKLMSSYQVVRIFWAFVSNLEEKLSISNEVKPLDLDLFTSETFVLLDYTGCYNVAAFLDENIWKKVQREAKRAIASLDSNRFNSFTNLFTTKMPFGLQYDLILKITNFEKIYAKCSAEDKFQYFGFYKILISKYIEKNLKYGLSQKALEIIPVWHKTGENLLVYGINLNPQFCMKVLELGPKQYEARSEEFKAFWGELSALRRFKDTSIYEAVYFDNVKTVQGKRLLAIKIIVFVLKEKLKLKFVVNGAEMESLLKVEKINNPFPTGSNEEAVIKVKAAQNELDKMLRNLKLPLPITAVQCTSDLYSYTDVFPPIPSGNIFKKIRYDKMEYYILLQETSSHVPHLIKPVKCVLQLAVNSKWPNTLEALQAMKTVYHFEISKLLRSEHEIKSFVTKKQLTCFFQGYAFELEIYHPKELALMRKNISADGVTFYRDSEESLSLEQNLEILPKIAGALNGIQMQFTSFGPSTCLIKRWLRAHMLDDYHISDTVVNLLNASLFLVHEPFDAPVLPQVAFLRFLKFMAYFDYNYQAIVVNFNDSIEDLNEQETKFLQNRQMYNHLHIITPFDDGKSLFTKNSPSVPVLNRIKVLAGQTYEHLLKCLDDGFELSFKSLFVPNLEGYHVLIHLNTNPRWNQQINTVHKNQIKVKPFNEEEDGAVIPVIGLDPVVAYLNELRRNFGHYALFFHDYYGSTVIGVLWKQNTTEVNDFKISHVNGCKLDNNKLVFNKEAVTEDFYNYGKGIVKTIEVQNQD